MHCLHFKSTMKKSVHILLALIVLLQLTTGYASEDIAKNSKDMSGSRNKRGSYNMLRLGRGMHMLRLGKRDKSSENDSESSNITNDDTGYDADVNYIRNEIDDENEKTLLENKAYQSYLLSLLNPDELLLPNLDFNNKEQVDNEERRLEDDTRQPSDEDDDTYDISNINGYSNEDVKRSLSMLRLGKRQLPMLRLGKRNMNMLRLGKRNMNMLRLGKRNMNMLRLGKRNMNMLWLGKRDMSMLRLGKRDMSMLRLGKREEDVKDP